MLILGNGGSPYGGVLTHYRLTTCLSIAQPCDIRNSSVILVTLVGVRYVRFQGSRCQTPMLD